MPVFMEQINLITLSPKSHFSASLEDLLSPCHQFRIYQISTLKDPLPLEIDSSQFLLLVDLDSLPGEPINNITLLRGKYPECSLLLISENKESIRLPSTVEAFLIDRESINCGLFPSFLHLLSDQIQLLHNYTQSQFNLSKRVTELDLIRKASLHLTMNLSLDSVLEAILESAMELISADDTHVFLYEHGVLTFASALFEGHQQKEPYMHPRQEGVTYHVAREGVKRVVNDTMMDSLFDDRPWEGSIISLPLKIGQKVLGVMNVALKRAHEFSEGEIRVLEFLGDQAAIAIQNAKLYEQAQQEIADRKKAEKAIQHLANHDALTGLPNRRLFNERINLEIARSQRNKLLFSLMLFDLDHLKAVNDSYGHNIGDMLLQAVAQRLLGLLRKSDTIARMGGDEFLLILPEMKQKEDAIHTADRILSALSTPFHLETHQINITTSIGVAFFPDDGEDADALIKKADLAMYNAKEKGGNTYHFYTS
jgi:diguanylate cyclase (GGDEF)-like protein